MSNPTQRLRDAIQAVINDLDDDRGWTVGQFVISMGLERVTPDGRVESCSWHWAPPEQPDWQIVGLLLAAVEDHNSAEIED
jgi:hypothetical protein